MLIVRILVTGMSGFIGSHVAAALAVSGHDVIGTYRSHSPRAVHRYERGLGGAEGGRGSIQSLHAELSDRESIRRIVQGVEGIVHIAGYVSDWGRREHFYKGNILPLHHFIEEMQRADTTIRFFIHTSSISVHGFGEHRCSSEEGPYYHLSNEYQKSKQESEELILSHAAQSSDPVISIIRPGNVYGPGDSTFLYPLLDAIKKGQIIYVDQGKYLSCPIFIDDLVAGYVAVLNKMMTAPDLVHGRVYNICSDESITWKDIISISAEQAHIRQPVLSIPKWLACAVAALITGLFRLLRIKNGPRITMYRVRNISNDYNFSISRAANELGWKPKTIFSRGMQASAKAWQEHEKA